MVCAMAREVGLDAAIDMEAAEELLQEHAAAVIPHLQLRGIAGDGNCLFRAAACQVPEGEEHHVALRAICAAGAADAWERYAPYLPPCSREQVLEWCRNMAQDRFWGDGLACRVLTDCLKRPMIIWRLMEPEQRPSCFVPALGVVGAPVQPIYLFLDERVRGAEHYWALVRGERPAQHSPWQALQPAAAGDGCRGSFRRRRLPASFFGTANQQASSGPWTRHGLTQGQMEELLLMQDQGASPAELAAKFFPGQPGKLDTLRRWAFADKEKIRARVREHVAAKTQAHSSRRAMAASCHIANNKCLQLQAERPPAASSWQQELGRRFSVEGSAAAGALPDQHSSQMPLAQEFRGWMRHASWTYCSRHESMVIKCQCAFLLWSLDSFFFCSSGAGGERQSEPAPCIGAPTRQPPSPVHALPHVTPTQLVWRPVLRLWRKRPRKRAAASCRRI